MKLVFEVTLDSKLDIDNELALEIERELVMDVISILDIDGNTDSKVTIEP